MGENAVAEPSVGTGDGLDVCDWPSLSDDGLRLAERGVLDSIAGSKSGWRRACLLRWSLRMKRLSHSGHTKRFSPGKHSA